MKKIIMKKKLRKREREKNGVANPVQDFNSQSFTMPYLRDWLTQLKVYTRIINKNVNINVSYDILII